MRTSTFLLAISILLGCSVPALADGLTCGATCHNPISITATITGNLTGIFVYKDANFYDYIRVLDTTTNTTGEWVLGNQTSTRFQSANLGHINRGDNLVFQLCVVPDFEPDHTCKAGDAIFASDPAHSDDGANHAVVGAPRYPAAPLSQAQLWTVWMEDFNKSLWNSPEPDYNDYVVSFLGSVSITCSPQCGTGPDSQANGEVVTPEPATLALLGSGLVGAFYRRRNSV